VLKSKKKLDLNKEVPIILALPFFFLGVEELEMSSGCTSTFVTSIVLGLVSLTSKLKLNLLYHSSSGWSLSRAMT
jgi:hypothetical protein